MIDKKSIHRLSKQFGAPQSELVKLIDDITKIVVEMRGSKKEAINWFKNQPIPGYSGKTAYDLVCGGEENLVLEYLEAVRAGVYA